MHFGFSFTAFLLDCYCQEADALKSQLLEEVNVPGLGGQMRWNPAVFQSNLNRWFPGGRHCPIV
jgi:hypothetical protein